MAALDHAPGALARPARGVAFGFFGFAALCVALGMGWGIQMSASHDHALAPAHAHLNLVGWTTMGLFGLYYAVTPSAAASRLARVHLAVAALGVVLLVPGIVLALQERGEILAVAGSFASLGSLAIFLAVLWRHGIGPAD